MATPAPSSPPLIPAVPLGLRRPMIMCGVLGVIGLVIAVFLGHWLMGVLFIAGMAMGLLNIRLVQRAVANVTADDHPSKQKMAVSSASRLLIITAVALVIGFLLKPDGIGVFIGLAVFQAVFVLNTTLPVLKGLRQQS